MFGEERDLRFAVFVAYVFCKTAKEQMYGRMCARSEPGRIYSAPVGSIKIHLSRCADTCPVVTHAVSYTHLTLPTILLV